MWRPRVLRTANFRLALSYAAVFSLSVFLLGVIVFFGVRSSIEQQLRGQIESEVGLLLVDYRDDGLEELQHDIRERIEDNPSRRLRYSLQNPEGRVVFDPLPAIPSPDGWYRVNAPERDADNPVLLRSLTLDGGYKLAVAADLDRLQDAERAIFRAFGWAFLFTLMAGALGGLWIGQRFLSQVDAITRVADRIGQGDVKERLPSRGTGDDLDQLATVINRMLDRIQQLLENVRQVSTSIAHDLRTPLGHLRQTLEALREGPGEPKKDALLDEALRQLDAILETFSALLRIAEVESGSRKAGFERLCLSGVLETLVEAYRPVAEDNGQHLTGDITPLLYMQGDRNLMTQLFANLVENALRHSGRGSRIHLALEAGPDGGFSASVSDTGPGIPKSEHANVFKPFYRLDASRSGPGSGLGMSLVSAIAGLHGLEVTLDNTQPGLKVHLSTPLSEPSKQD